MKDETVIKRYADAFMSFCRDTGDESKMIQDLKNLRNSVIPGNAGFLGLLKNPDISFGEKCDFLDRTLKEGFQQETLDFLKLLLEKGRIELITGIAEYIRTTYAYAGETEALLRTTYPLDLELVKAIKDKLESKLKKKLKLYLELDGSLLGGIQVVIGNTVIDNSVRGSLDELKHRLLNVRV